MVRPSFNRGPPSLKVSWFWAICFVRNIANTGGGDSMRRESVTVQKCKKQMDSLGIDSQSAYHRVKLILKIYRDVVWVLSERAEELHEYAWELGNRDAGAGLC